ncbi:MAG: SxtJ family membrane protein [Candidatus Glassbacteria bacterium]
MNSTETKAAQLRKFGMVFGIILGVIALISLWRGRESVVTPFLILSVVFILISLVYPKLLTPLYWLMLRVSGYMGWVNTRILLVIVYYLVFTPVAILFKLIGKDPLSRKFEKEASSYWKRRDESGTDTITQYEKQF